MPLTNEDLAPLYLPGTIRLPSPFPAVGDLDLQENGAQYPGVEALGALLVVRHRIWPSTKVCWTIRVELVSAILLTEGDKLDCATAKWVFTPSVPKLRSLPEASILKGIVFVPENAPVMMRIEMGTTASESADYPIHGWLGGCDPCKKVFSYESTMGGPDKG